MTEVHQLRDKIDAKMAAAEKTAVVNDTNTRNVFCAKRSFSKHANDRLKQKSQHTSKKKMLPLLVTVRSCHPSTPNPSLEENPTPTMWL